MTGASAPKQHILSRTIPQNSIDDDVCRARCSTMFLLPQLELTSQMACTLA